MNSTDSEELILFAVTTSSAAQHTRKRGQQLETISTLQKENIESINLRIEESKAAKVTKPGTGAECV